MGSRSGGQDCFVPSLLRTLLTLAALTVVAAVVDALLFLAPAGSILSPAEVLGLLALAALAGAALWRNPHPAHFAAPFLGLIVFRLLVVPLVEVPTDAVLRDAQAGIAAAVVLIAQLCVVGVGFALGRRRVEPGPLL